jgi:hypothetical protein
MVKDYSQSIIYIIHHKDDLEKEISYIGSTTNLYHRTALHKHQCNTQTAKGYNTKKYQHIRENGGFENWVINEIEQYPCNNREEIEKREQYWVDFYESTLNKRKPYTRDSREQKNERYRIWRLNHPDYHKNYMRTYRFNKNNQIV